jgi:hypothetical protein
MATEMDARAGILANYRVNAQGRIVSPGKFEGEMLYVPYFWGAFLDGGADYDDGRVLGFRITFEDRKFFPEIPRRKRVIRLVEDSNGFVHEV